MQRGIQGPPDLASTGRIEVGGGPVEHDHGRVGEHKANQSELLVLGWDQPVSEGAHVGVEAMEKCDDTVPGANPNREHRRTEHALLGCRPVGPAR